MGKEKKKKREDSILHLGSERMHQPKCSLLIHCLHVISYGKKKRVGNGEIDVSPVPFVVSSLECQKGALYVLGIPINKVIREDELVKGRFGRSD